MKLNYWLTSLAWRISLFFGLLAFLVLFSIQALPASAQAPAYVRLIQASADVGTADVFVDGKKLLSSFEFGTVTDYKQLPPGPHKVQVALIGKGSGAAVIVYTLVVRAGVAYTVAAIGTKATGLALDFHIDDNSLTSDMAKLRVYHLAPGIGVVSVASGSKTLLSGLGYSYASDYLTLPAGSYTFNVTTPQPTSTIAVSAALKPNMVTSIFALSTGSQNPKLQIVIAQVKGIPALSRTGSDPYAHIASSQPLPLLVPWMVAVLALGGVSAGLAVRRLLVARQSKREPLTSNGTPCRRCSKSGERLHATRRGGSTTNRGFRATIQRIGLRRRRMVGAWATCPPDRVPCLGGRYPPWLAPALEFPMYMLCLLLCGLALLAPLALPGCGQQSSSSHQASPIHQARPIYPSTGRLLIPAIGVNATIEPIGVLSDGTLATPTQDPWNDVGWYNGGPRPGEQGSAVINGHLDRPGGSPAVFWHLNELHIGDKVIVVDTQGRTLHFHVTHIGSYALQEAPVQDIFGNTAGRFLNLMTCAGGWIPSEHQTSSRLVVYTSLD